MVKTPLTGADADGHRHCHCRRRPSLSSSLSSSSKDCWLSSDVLDSSEVDEGAFVDCRSEMHEEVVWEDSAVDDSGLRSIIRRYYANNTTKASTLLHQSRNGRELIPGP